MREFEGRAIRKVSLYFLDPATASWRCGEEPHHVRGFLALMIIAAAAHFLVVQGFLAIQFGITALKTPFLCYKKSYPSREKKEFFRDFFSDRLFRNRSSKRAIALSSKIFFYSSRLFYPYLLQQFMGVFLEICTK